MGATIFVIDSSPAVRRMVEQLSSPDGYQFVGFQDGPKALEAARTQHPALIVADFHLEQMTFSGFCKEIGKLDHLAETLVVSLIDPSDKLDESKLRSLGVRAFLKKPFQSEQLLDTVKTALAGTAGATTQRSGAAKPTKARSWPPASSGADDDDDTDTEPMAADTSAAPEQTRKEPPAMPPTPAPTAAARPERAAAPSDQAGEGLLKNLLDHLVQSAARQTDRTLTEQLSAAVAKELAAQLGPAVQAAVQQAVTRQVADALAPDRLVGAMQEPLRAVVREEVSRHSRQAQNGLQGEMASAITQAVSELAPNLIEQSAGRLLGELADSGVKKHLPDALRAHLNGIDQTVKQEVERAAATCARQTADDVVRELAADPIRQAVERIVPDLAESQIRAEITRLSAAD